MWRLKGPIDFPHAVTLGAGGARKSADRPVGERRRTRRPISGVPGRVERLLLEPQVVAKA